MGFFSSLGGFFSGAVRAVGLFLSGTIRSAGHILSTLASNVGGIAGAIFGKAAGMLGVLSTILTGPLGPILGPILIDLIIKGVSKVLEIIGKKLDLIEDEDKVEEIGYRMEEAAEKHPEWKQREDFPDLKSYYEYLKEQIPDSEINDLKLRQNFTKYTSIGAAAITEEWGRTANIILPTNFIVDCGRARLKETDVQTVVDAFKELGYKEVKFHDFLMGKLDMKETNQIQDKLLDLYHKVNPDITADKFYSQVQEWRHAARHDEALVHLFKPELETVKKQANEGKGYEDIKITEA